MTIIDTYNEIIALFDKMGGIFEIDLWERYASDISGELLEKCKYDSRDYVFETQVVPIIEQAMTNRVKLDLAHASFLQVTENMSKRIEEVLGTDLQVDIIFYVGLCNGAGWATELNGKPAVLLGVEKIIELDWCDDESMTALIHHELGHIWHFSLHDISKQYSHSVVKLFCEGVAMHFEQLILGDFNYYHQSKNGWLDWCQANRTEIKFEFFRRVNANESTQDFFGDRCNYQGYSDVGYYLGCEFVKWLVQRYPFAEIAKLDYDSVCKNFYSFAG
ncbi:MAG: hypothetical protein LBC71_07050 [Oscillospiraceae bacterium]|nr:hypothetical protein [Oscillospiraceae bacterium]